MTLQQRLGGALIVALVAVILVVLLLAASDSITRILWRVSLQTH